MKKWYCTAMIMIMLLSGCTAQSEKDMSSGKSDEKVTVRDELAQLDLSLLKEKIDHGDTFVFMVTQSTCNYCNNMKRTVVPYMREHSELPFYELEIDMLGTKKLEINENFNKLQDLIPEYGGSTPELFYMNKGELEKQSSGDMDEYDLHNFFVDCGLVNEKRKQKVERDTGIKESPYLTATDFIKIDKKINEKGDLYLFLAQSDRYNAMFSEKLVKLLDNRKQEILILKLDDDTSSYGEDYGSKLEASQRLEAVLTAYQYTPALFHIKDGEVVDFIMDNVSEKELSDWFDKQ